MEILSIKFKLQTIILRDVIIMIFTQFINYDYASSTFFNITVDTSYTKIGQTSILNNYHSIEITLNNTNLYILLINTLHSPKNVLLYFPINYYMEYC